MAIVPPELLVMVVVELSVSPLAMVIAAVLVMPLLAVRVELVPVTAIVALLLLVTRPVSVPKPLICEPDPELEIPLFEALKVPPERLIWPPAVLLMLPPLPVPVACTMAPELIVIEPPALLIVPLFPPSVRVPETVIVPVLLLVMPPATLSLELSVSPLAMVIVAELVRPLLAVMLPPVTASVAPLLLVTAPVSVPKPLI